MDWHLVEVGVVTTLSIWVYLFSPSNLSRLAAAAMFFLNLVWILIEREGRTRKEQPGTAQPGAGDHGLREPVSEADGPDTGAAEQLGKSQASRNPRVI